jgi:hypothetical protein
MGITVIGRFIAPEWVMRMTEAIIMDTRRADAIVTIGVKRASAIIHAAIAPVGAMIATRDMNAIRVKEKILIGEADEESFQCDLVVDLRDRSCGR